MDVNVRDYGAVGDDTTDDTLAFRNALNAIRSTGGTCFVPTGTYKIAPGGIMGVANGRAITDGMHLVGDVLTDGAPSSFLHVHSDATHQLIHCLGDNWSIEKIGIDMSGFYGGPGKVPIDVGGAGYASGWLVDRCHLLDTGRAAIIARGTRFQISNCKITNNTVITFGDGHVPEGVITTMSGERFPSYGKYLNNTIDGCSGYDTLGNNHLFKNNTCTNMSFAAGIFMDGAKQSLSQNTDNVLIGNVCSLGNEGPDNYTQQEWTQARGFEIGTPYTFMFANSAHDNCGTGIALRCHNSVMAFNRAIDNGRDIGNPLHILEPGFGSSGLSEPFEFVNNGRSLFFCNTSRDTRPAMDKTQTYGIKVYSDNVRCLSVMGNDFHGNATAEGDYRLNQPNVTIAKGRDMFHNTLDERQRGLLKALLDRDAYPGLTEPQYDKLNELLR